MEPRYKEIPLRVITMRLILQAILANLNVFSVIISPIIAFSQCHKNICTDALTVGNWFILFPAISFLMLLIMAYLVLRSKGFMKKQNNPWPGNVGNIILTRCTHIVLLGLNVTYLTFSIIAYMKDCDAGECSYWKWKALIEITFSLTATIIAIIVFDIILNECLMMGIFTPKDTMKNVNQNQENVQNNPQISSYGHLNQGILLNPADLQPKSFSTFKNYNASVSNQMTSSVAKQSIQPEYSASSMTPQSYSQQAISDNIDHPTTIPVAKKSIQPEPIEDRVAVVPYSPPTVIENREHINHVITYPAEARIIRAEPPMNYYGSYPEDHITTVHHYKESDHQTYRPKKVSVQRVIYPKTSNARKHTATSVGSPYYHSRTPKVSVVRKISNDSALEMPKYRYSTTAYEGRRNDAPFVQRYLRNAPVVQEVVYPSKYDQGSVHSMPINKHYL